MGHNLVVKNLLLNCTIKVKCTYECIINALFPFSRPIRFCLLSPRKETEKNYNKINKTKIREERKERKKKKVDEFNKENTHTVAGVSNFILPTI